MTKNLNASKVENWRKKMKQYRASVTRKQLISDLKKAGFSIKEHCKTDKK